MNAYRKIVTKIGNVFLLMVLLLSTIASLVTYPVVALWGNGFDEGHLITTLSILLAGLCLAKLLGDGVDKTLTASMAVRLLLVILTALAVLWLRKPFPFVLRGYLFPLLTGLTTPHLLLSYFPKRDKPWKRDKLFAVLWGLPLLFLVLLLLYGAWFASPLMRVILCRVIALPLLWFAPFFIHYATRWGIVKRYTAIALVLLPIFPLFGILWDEMFRLSPLAVLCGIAALGYESYRSHRNSMKQPHL